MFTYRLLNFGLMAAFLVADLLLTLPHAYA